MSTDTTAAVPAHLQRVISERDELLDRLTKLKAFFPSTIFGGLDPAEQSDMRAQAEHMAEYADVLTRRLLRAGVEL